MRITINQLKKLIRETVEDIDPMALGHQAENLPSEKEDMFQLYSDMYKEMYNIRPRWLRMDDVSEDELRAMIEDLEQGYEREIKARQEESKEAEDFYRQLKQDDMSGMGYEGMEDLESLPSRSGMGKRLEESIKKAVREAVKEEEEKLKGDQEKLDKAPPFGKLTGADFKALRKKSKKKKED